MSLPLTALGIESSCDDTAAAIVRRLPDGSAEILSSVVRGQKDLHQDYGGIVPEIAARAHSIRLDGCTEAALSESSRSLDEVDLIAVTAGPGLIGGLISGVAFAKGLAAGSGKPLLGINHLAGHALTARMTHGVSFPYLALLASGGHCQFLAVQSAASFVRLGGTIDDAPGEAFDKSARLLGLPQPGGPSIETAALRGDPRRFQFPRPLSGRMGCNLSFSGLKTALLQARQNAVRNDRISDRDAADLAAGFQQAVVDVFAEKSKAAFDIYRQRFGTEAQTFVLCGGVASNKAVRANLDRICAERRICFIAPQARYCTDNAAMIAWAGLEVFRPGHSDPFDLRARPRWPLDSFSASLIGSGKKGPKS